MAAASFYRTAEPGTTAAPVSVMADPVYPGCTWGVYRGCIRGMYTAMTPLLLCLPPYLRFYRFYTVSAPFLHRLSLAMLLRKPGQA